jgi:hypothetical protein
MTVIIGWQGLICLFFVTSRKKSTFWELLKFGQFSIFQKRKKGLTGTIQGF